MSIISFNPHLYRKKWHIHTHKESKQCDPFNKIEENENGDDRYKFSLCEVKLAGVVIDDIII